MPRHSIRQRLECLPEICSRIEPFLEELSPSLANSYPLKKFKDILVDIKDEHRIEFLKMSYNLDTHHLKLPSKISSKVDSLLNSLPSKIAYSRPVNKVRDILSNDDDEPQPNTSIFALLIGIDKYQSDRWQELQGGIADAKAMQGYLEKDLAIPSCRIRTLHGEEATRGAIVNELRYLKDNPSIKPGDSILIFYAGHGDATAAPEGWGQLGEEIQLLVPYDGDTEQNGEKIYGIPDRTICALLEDVARVKGDDITVILDCCHATSLTRGFKFWDTRVRGRRSGVNIPPTLDKDIWGSTRGAAIPSRYEKTGLSSHVILTACGAKEVAEENCWGGVFTQALLKKLRQLGSRALTCSELIQQVSLPRQNPQCEGRHKNRLCFSSKVLLPSTTYSVQQAGDIYTMNAGTAHGITTGAVFTVYDDKEQTSVQMKALKPDQFSTKLTLAPDQPKFDLQDRAFATQIKAGTDGDLLVHYAQDEDLTHIAQAATQKANADGKNLYSIVPVEERKQASLSVVIESNRILFDILDEEAARHGMERLSETITADPKELHRVLLFAGHYFWHYRRKPVKPQKSLVTIEFMMLQEMPDESDGKRTKVLEPCSDNLINDEKVIELVSDEDNIYGIKVTNTGKVPLYISAFFFDHNTLAIHSFYQPPTGPGRVDPSLEPNKSLSIGYGSNGTEPYSYIVSDGFDKTWGRQATPYEPWGSKETARFPKHISILVHGDHSCHHTRSRSGGQPKLRQ
ncbi:hypothetical protein CPB86DRAFT_13179 [Serendipita vermifera]|nr:hypothetical protein CPB86DRAFT_13179 [Serendipita vermifera]